MSTTQGTNGRTGTTASKAEQAKADAKAAKLAERNAQTAAKAGDKRMHSKMVSVGTGLSDLGVIFEQGITEEWWKHLTDAEGKPFRGWLPWISARIASVEAELAAQGGLLSVAVKKPLIAKMREHGASVRQAAEAAKVSTGTASEADKGADHTAAKQGADNAKRGRSARPNGTGTAEEQSAANAKAVASLVTIAKRIQELAGGLTDEQLATVLEAVNPCRTEVMGVAKMRVEAAEKRAANAAKRAAAKAAKAAKAAPAPAVAPSPADMPGAAAVA